MQVTTETTTLEKLIVAKLLICIVGRLIVFTRSHHWPLCWAKLIQSTPSNAACLWATSRFCKWSVRLCFADQDLVCISRLSCYTFLYRLSFLLWRDHPFLWCIVLAHFSHLFIREWFRFRFFRNVLFADTFSVCFRRVRILGKSDY